MLDIREIKYFVACVQAGSFSKAAESLFTTQSSVSKIVKAMEEKTGVLLFERLPKGIRLTPEAEYMYPFALSILENLKKLEIPDKAQIIETLSVSCNPSSWFADNFVKYYELKKNEHIHYQVHSADCREIVERVKERRDDVGFVYIVKDQMSAFQYYISRNFLEFHFLKETAVIMYSKEGCDKSNDRVPDFSHLKLIQHYPDEFSPDNYRNILDAHGHTVAEAETVVVTNSDYIMERILQAGDLVNISGGYLSENKQGDTMKEISLCSSDKKILFGYLQRKGELLSDTAMDFLEFLKEKL